MCPAGSCAVLVHVAYTHAYAMLIVKETHIIMPVLLIINLQKETQNIILFTTRIRIHCQKWVLCICSWPDLAFENLYM